MLCFARFAAWLIEQREQPLFVDAFSLNCVLDLFIK